MFYNYIAGRLLNSNITNSHWIVHLNKLSAMIEGFYICSPTWLKMEGFGTLDTGTLGIWQRQGEDCISPHSSNCSVTNSKNTYSQDFCLSQRLEASNLLGRKDAQTLATESSAPGQAQPLTEHLISISVPHSGIWEHGQGSPDIWGKPFTWNRKIKIKKQKKKMVMMQSESKETDNETMWLNILRKIREILCL